MNGSPTLLAAVPFLLLASVLWFHLLVDDMDPKREFLLAIKLVYLWLEG